MPGISEITLNPSFFDQLATYHPLLESEKYKAAKAVVCDGPQKYHKDPFFHRRSVAELIFNLTNNDKKILNLFEKKVIDAVNFSAPNQTFLTDDELLSKAFPICTVGFAGQGYEDTGPIEERLRQQVVDARLRGTIPVFVTGADKNGIGGCVQRVAESEGVKTISLLSEFGLADKQRNDPTGRGLITEIENIIPVPSEQDSWSTSTEERGIEFLPLIALIYSGVLHVENCGSVGADECLQGILLRAKTELYTPPNANGGKGYLEKEDPDKEPASILKLLEKYNILKRKGDGRSYGWTNMPREPSSLESVGR
ncbi:hypothetical protein NUH87_30940 [Pseudomonas batumici]|uniref:hypothetical protein n=1 Tax=Pseudomonas batumici TaxID=226910 RepID=UPI0030CD0CE8